MFGDFNRATRHDVPETAPLLLIFDLAVLCDDTGTMPVYGAKDLLRSLKRQGHTLAVTSGQAQETCISALKQSRFLDFFEDRVYAQKPDFQKILAELKVGPNGVAAVEIDPDGVKAAKAAGLAVLAYADPRFSAQMDARRQELERAGADIVVEMLIDIDTVLTTRAVQARPSRTPGGPGFTL